LQAQHTKTLSLLDMGNDPKGSTLTKEIWGEL